MDRRSDACLLTERNWLPTSEHSVPVRHQLGEDGVFILYEYELKNGDRHRNAEFITVRCGRLVETQVFFGGRAQKS